MAESKDKMFAKDFEPQTAVFELKDDPVKASPLDSLNNKITEDDVFQRPQEEPKKKDDIKSKEKDDNKLEKKDEAKSKANDNATKKAEEYTSPKKHKKLKIVLLVLLGIVLAGILALAIFIVTPFRADQKAIDVLNDQNSPVQIYGTSNDKIVFKPANPKAGFIFYPGARVQMESYAPMLEKLSEKGIMCILMYMPLNMFPVDLARVENVKSEFPEIHNWYIGGHSMGASASLTYAKDHPSSFKGVVLMGCNPEQDLSNTNMSLLTISATEDGLVPPEEYDGFRDKLPHENSRIIIYGGNHAHYGDYGEQWPDKQATISREEQQYQAVRAMEEFINNSKR